MAEFKRRAAPGIRQNWEAYKASRPATTPKPAVQREELAAINAETRAKRPAKQFGVTYR